MTDVNVRELNTDVTVDGAPSGPPSVGGGRQHPWDELDRMRESADELARLRRRTSAEGFDDH